MLEHEDKDYGEQQHHDNDESPISRDVGYLIRAGSPTFSDNLNNSEAARKFLGSLIDSWQIKDLVYNNKHPIISMVAKMVVDVPKNNKAGAQEYINIVDENGNLKYSIPTSGRKISGANGTSYLDALEHTADGTRAVVIKEVKIRKSSTDAFKHLLREHDVWLKQGEPSELLYDPQTKSLFLTMPLRDGEQSAKIIENQSEQIVKDLDDGNKLGAYIELHNMFQLLGSILKELLEFERKTGGLVHGDAHLNNVNVKIKKPNGSMLESGDILVKLIDFGGSCPSDIKKQEYIDSGMPIGGGGLYTAPELPFQSIMVESKYAEFSGIISPKTDLHGFVADFIFRGLLALPGFLEPAHNSNALDIASIVSDFSEWALLYCANSNWFSHQFLPEGHPLLEKRNALMRGRNASEALRVDVPTAIAKLEAFINRIKAAVRLVQEGVDPGSHVTVKERVGEIENKSKKHKQ